VKRVTGIVVFQDYGRLQIW